MDNTHNEEEINLRDYFNVIRKRRKVLYVFTFIVVTLVTIITFSMTPQYEGVCRVMIEKGEVNSLTNQRVYSRYDPEFYETQFQLIKSKRVAKRVVKLLNLVDNWDRLMGRERSGEPSAIRKWVRGLKSAVKGMFTSGDEREKAPPSRDEIVEAIAEELLENISVSPVKNSRLVAISFLSPNPAFSAQVANTIAKAYIDEVYTMKMETTRRTLEWMTKKANEERTRLESVEKKLQRYMGDNDIITMENRIAVLPQQLSEISTQLVRAESKRKELEAEYNLTRHMNGNVEDLADLPQMTQSKELNQLLEDIRAAEQKIVELSKKYGYKHPLMIKAKDDLKLLNDKRKSIILREVQRIRHRYNLALTTEKNLRAQLEKTKKLALSLNEKFIQYGVIKREVDTNKQLFDALILKIKEKSITEEGQSVNLYIVDHAQEPQFPVKPRKKVNLLLGLIVGVFGGIGFVFFLEYLDNTVKDPEEFRRRFTVPVLALTPFLDEDKKDKGESHNVDTMVRDNPLSPFAESVKALRTSILVSHADAPPKSLLVTSSRPGEGKTTQVINLAESLVQSGYRVLIIDADLRKPRIHKALKCSARHGLSSYLAGMDKECNIQSSGCGVDVVTAGPVPPNPSELLTSKRMQALLERMMEQYDYILCDSPPLLSISDPQILASFFAGTLLVCKAHETTYDSIQHSLEKLRMVNANLIGVVINAYNVKHDDYYYYQYSYGSYAQEPESEAGNNG